MTILGSRMSNCINTAVCPHFHPYIDEIELREQSTLREELRQQRGQEEGQLESADREYT